MAEPSVIHHQHLYPKAGRLSGDLQKLLGIKIKISSLPVIDEDRSLFIFINPSDQMVSIQIVKVPGHAADTLCRIQADDLRRLKALPRHKLPAEILRMDPHHGTNAAKLTLLDLRQKISGIDKVHSIDIARLLRGRRALPCDKGMLLMTGLSPHGAGALFALSDRAYLNHTFPCPGTV